MNAIDPVGWQLIIHRILEQQCVPILGAAANVSSAARGYKGLPLAKEVARALAREMKFKPEDLDGLDLGLDLAKIALEFEFETDRSALIRELLKIIPDRERDPSPLLRVLARLPLRLIITTNYDRLMERALREADRPFMVVVQPTGGFGGRERRQLEEELASYDGLILYKLHGSFADDTLDLVITEDDYITFMGTIKDRVKGIPNMLLAQMVDATCVFLGYGIRDWDFRMLYGSLPARKLRKNFAVLKTNPAEFWSRYLGNKGISVIEQDIYDFADELQERWLSAPAPDPGR